MMTDDTLDSESNENKCSSKNKYIDTSVRLLDSSSNHFRLAARAVGKELYNQVVEYLQLVEYDYFDLEYVNKDGHTFWIDHLKPIQKQATAHKDYVYTFAVKFYTPYPNLLEDEFTRYLFALQIRKDLQLGRLPCSETTAALLFAYIVQSSIGDFLEDVYLDHTYLVGLQLMPTMTVGFLLKVAECHRNLYGQSPADADYNLLDTVRKVELYGVRMRPAKDSSGTKLHLSVSHSGILVYQNNSRVNTFSWARIRKLSFKRKRFLVKLHPDAHCTAEFVFDSRDECKNFWKQCIEHHAFFRCQAVRHTTSSRGRMVTKGSSFRYTGRTQKQLVEYVRENYIKLSPFERSTTSCRTLSSQLGNLTLPKSQHPTTPLPSHIELRGVQSDYGPSTNSRIRPQTDPLSTNHLTDSQLSPAAFRSLAVAVPIIRDPLNQTGGYQTIHGVNQLIRQVRSNSITHGAIGTSTLPKGTHLLQLLGNASSGTYTMDSSVSANSPDDSCTNSPPMGERSANVAQTFAEYADHFIPPDSLRIEDVTVRPISTCNQVRATHIQPSLNSPIPQMTNSVMIGQTAVVPRAVNLSIDPRSPYATMLVQSPPTSANVLTNVPASHPAFRSPMHVLPGQQLIRPTQQPHVPAATYYTLLTAAPGSGLRPMGNNLIYIDRNTGRPFVPVLTGGGGQLLLQNPLVRPPNFITPSSVVSTTEPAAHFTPSVPEPAAEQREIQSECVLNNSTGHDVCGPVQTNVSNTIPSDSLPIGSTLRIRRSGPPPPTPERWDSILQRSSMHFPQVCMEQNLPSLISSNSSARQVSKTHSLLVDSGPEEETEPSESQMPPHPLAMGLMAGPNGYHLSSCLNFNGRVRSALSTKSLCATSGDNSDEEDRQTELGPSQHMQRNGTNGGSQSDTERRPDYSEQQLIASSNLRARSSLQLTGKRKTSLSSDNGQSNVLGHRRSHSIKHFFRHQVDDSFHLISELIQTERTYGRDLSVVCVCFRHSVTALDNDTDDPQNCLLDDLASRLFDLLDPIYIEHQKLLAAFEGRLNLWTGRKSSDDSASSNQSTEDGGKLSLSTERQLDGQVYPIGDLFLDHLHILSHYEEYMLEIESLILAIDSKICSNPQLTQTIRQFEAQKLCYLPFFVFLLKPMHRLLQYRAAFERLMRHYGEQNPDAPNCRIIHSRLLEVIQTCWESYKRLENVYKLLEIQRDLIGFVHLSNATTTNATIVNGDLTNASLIGLPGRQFIREGLLQKLSKKGYQPRIFYLFSDQLVYAGRTNTSYLQFKVHGQFPLNDLTVEEAEPAHSFTVFSGNQCFLVAAPSEWQRDRWLEDISRAVLAAKTKSNPLSTVCDGTHKEACIQLGSVELEHPQVLQRATTSIQVCWHRSFTYSMQDILRANEYETSGYLLRKFKHSNGWQRLWVVYAQNCLFFYKTYRDDCPLASLPLLGYQITMPATSDPVRRDHVIKLQFKNHIYYFRGETRHSFERWFDYLTCATGGNRRNKM